MNKHIQRFLFLALLAGIFSNFSAREAHAQPSFLSGAASQRLAVVDVSSSMSGAKWFSVQQIFPLWLQRQSTNGKVGLVTVGGECVGSPSVSLPVGAMVSDLEAAFRQLAPSGGTPLNLVLAGTPKLFDLNSQGGREITLFTDGQDSCGGDTCALARDLYNKHQIVIHVALLDADPKLRQLADCITSATTGTVTDLTKPTLPSTPLFGGGMPTGMSLLFGLPWLDFWRLVVWALYTVAGVLTARVIYRHLVNVASWSPPPARIYATFVAILASTFVGVMLFSPWVALQVGLAILLLILAAVPVVIKMGAAKNSPATGPLDPPHLPPTSPGWGDEDSSLLAKTTTISSNPWGEA